MIRRPAGTYASECPSPASRSSLFRQTHLPVRTTPSSGRTPWTCGGHSYQRELLPHRDESGSGHESWARAIWHQSVSGQRFIYYVFRPCRHPPRRCSGTPAGQEIRAGFHRYTWALGIVEYSYHVSLCCLARPLVSRCFIAVVQLGVHFHEPLALTVQL